MSNIQVLILAGGIGKRFWPLGVNKSVVKFLDKPIIEYIIDDLIKAKIKIFIIVVNKSNQELIKNICQKKKIIYKTIIQKEANGMADGLLIAKDQVGKNPLLIVNANDFFDKHVFSNFINKINNQ